jgi:hypothetical protein
MLKLSYLLRLRRLERAFGDIYFRASISYNGQLIFQIFFMVLFSLHLLTCCWASLALPYAPYSWYDYTREAHEGGESGGETFFYNPTWRQMYVMSTYWSLYTVLGIGYGDMMPQNMTELSYMNVAMLYGAIVWACVIANIVTIAASLDDAEEEHLKKLDDAKDFVIWHSDVLGSEIKSRILNYFHNRKFVNMSDEENEVLHGLSPELQLVLTESFHGPWVNYTWLRHFSGPVLVQLCGSMSVVLHPPGELTVNGQVFSVAMKGMAFYGGHVLRRGDTWGDDFIIANYLLRANPQALALSYFCAGVITYRTLEGAFDEHPDERSVFDDIHARLTFKRGLLTIVEALKERIGMDGWKKVQEYQPDAGKSQTRASLLTSMVESTRRTEVLKRDPKQDFLEKFLEITVTGMVKIRDFEAIEEEAKKRPKTVEDKLKHLRTSMEHVEATCERMEEEKNAFVRRVFDRIEQLEELLASATALGEEAVNEEEEEEEPPGDGQEEPPSP